VLQQRAAAALALALLSLIAMMLIGNLQRAAYVAAVALVVAVIALALAISAMKAAKRAGHRRPRAAVAGVVLGAAGALVSASALIELLAFSAQFTQYANCLNGAITAAARNVCEQQLNNSLREQITVLGGK
jgi:peptidoglycan/LPS O-acetylase OafA/YrhL